MLFYNELERQEMSSDFLKNKRCHKCNKNPVDWTEWEKGDYPCPVPTEKDYERATLWCDSCIRPKDTKK